MPHRVHILDDDASIVRLITTLCTSLGLEVDSDQDSQSALRKIEANPPDLLIVDLQLGEMSGLEVIKRVRGLSPNTRVIMVTGFSSVATAVEAMRLGAFDYVTKPFELKEFLQTIRQALKTPVSPFEESELKPTPASENLQRSPALAFGSSPQIQKVLETLRRIANVHCTVLLTGEAGVGKASLVHYLHDQSHRHSTPCKTVHVSAYSPEALELELFGSEAQPETSVFARAKGGRVHLAEIHRMPLRIQSRLSAFLAQKTLAQLDVRLVCSSQVNLEQWVDKGQFRQDLFFKISVVPLTIPPLSKRREDIAGLVQHYLQRAAGNSKAAFDDFAMKLLAQYEWPGNISELANVVEHAFAMSENPLITADALPSKLQHCKTENSHPFSPNQEATQQFLPLGMPLHEFVELQQRWYIEETLKFFQGSREKTASSLGISVATLYRKLDLKAKNRTTL